MFKIDGVEYNMLCSIQRTAEMRSSDISGLMLDRTHFNDVLGTYLSYSITIAVPVGEEDDYADLYEVLTDPVSEHVIEVPYSDTTVTLTVMIQDVTDRYVGEELRDGVSVKVWRSTSFTAVSTRPFKMQ